MIRSCERGDLGLEPAELVLRRGPAGGRGVGRRLGGVDLRPQVVDGSSGDRARRGHDRRREHDDRGDCTESARSAGHWGHVVIIDHSRHSEAWHNASERPGSKPSASHPTGGNRQARGRPGPSQGQVTAGSLTAVSAKRMAGELALVTGSTSGIGQAIAVEFAAEGARVVVHGRDGARGRAVVDRIDGRRAVPPPSSPPTSPTEAACTDLVARVRELARRAHGPGEQRGREHGRARSDSIAGHGHGHWEAALRVNLTAPMWLCRRRIPHMLAAGHGSIVNISSRQAERPSRGLAAYAASKGGLNALTRAHRRRLRDRRHPVQHDQPRLHAQRTPRRRHRPRAAGALERHAPHPARRGARRRARGRVPREPRVGVRHRHQPPARRRQQHRARASSLG